MLKERGFGEILVSKTTVCSTSKVSKAIEREIRCKTTRNDIYGF